MNKKHGLVATAWMLGGGLLLNASLVEAQVAAPADEYYAPQRSAPFSAKKAPGLLPEILRNADASKNNSVARPISPSDSLSAGRKINGTAPTTKRASNRAAIMPANHQNEPTIQSANQGEAAPSPVQKQLEELYRKDGRPMPQMNFNQTPIPASGQVPKANPNPNAGNRPNAAPTNTVPPKPRSLMSKLNPFSRTKAAPAPLPNHPAAPVPNTAARPQQLQPRLVPGANGIKPAGVNSGSSFNNAAPRALPVPAAATPAPQPATAQPSDPGSSGLSNSLPPVPGDPGYQAPAASNANTIAIPPAPASVDEALENAFNDMPEAKGMPEEKVATEEKVEAEAAKPAEPKAAETENPFSGLSLDEEFGPAPKPAEEKPTAAEPKAATEPKSETNSIVIEPGPTTKEIKADEIPLPSETAAAEPAKEEVDAKMKLIAERGELRGLKGFCPVALRDDRDLRNALPEHHSTFKGRTFYFSTADAKAVFDEHPEHYAPISGGQDVVLLKEKVTKEGSLDHAVWFKDRLYLFTSQKTLEQFVATPHEFAISE